MNSKRYAIPSPCSEDWNKMTPTEQGAFCAKCTKEVLDCTSLSSKQIDHKLTHSNQPCVRIYPGQIDELNFLEWFHTLTLKKRLKYIFLFAFLLVTNGIHSQDFIEPQQVVIDTADWVTQAELDATYEQQDHSQIPEYFPLHDFKWEQPIGGAIATETLILGFTVIKEYPEFTELCISPIKAPISDFGQVKELEAATVNQVAVGKNRYSFQIREDFLIFHSNAIITERIALKIHKKDSDEIVYFDPIRIPEGQREVYFDLSKYENGTYIITIEGETTTKAIALTYW